MEGVMQQFVLMWNKWCMFPIRFELSSFPRSGDEWWHFYLEAIWYSAASSSLRQKTISCLAVWRTVMAHFSRPISVTNEEFHKLKASCCAFVFTFSKTFEKLRIKLDYLPFMLRRLCTCKFTPSLDEIKNFVIRGDVNLQRWLEAFKRVEKSRISYSAIKWLQGTKWLLRS